MQAATPTAEPAAEVHPHVELLQRKSCPASVDVMRRRHRMLSMRPLMQAPATTAEPAAEVRLTA